MAHLTPCEPRRVTTRNSHSSERGTLPTASLIIKQVIPYQTRGGTYCPGVSTLMTRSLADSSMTNHITWQILTISTILNLANHSIESHHGHLTLRQMEDQHSQHSTQVKLNIIKMKRLVRWLKTVGISITTNHKKPIVKYDSLGNQLMQAASVN
jgi:hypothetical protein